MRVLALADQRPPLDPALMAKRLHVDAVVLLCDLDRAWIESLRMLRIPRGGQWQISTSAAGSLRASLFAWRWVYGCGPPRP